MASKLDFIHFNTSSAKLLLNTGPYECLGVFFPHTPLCPHTITVAQ